MADKKDIKHIGRGEKAVPNPTVFMLPVTEYRVVETPEELAQWEEFMSSKYGLEVSAKSTHSHTWIICDGAEASHADTDRPF